MIEEIECGFFSTLLNVAYPVLVVGGLGVKQK